MVVYEAMQYLDRALASELYTTAQLESELDLTESSTMREWSNHICPKVD